CDGLVDEDDPDIDVFTLTAWGRDNDADGYGTDRDLMFACQQPEGFGFANTDCDDTRADINPGMPEICNPDEPVDDDCDGLIDDADPDVSEDSYLEWYADRDGDGFGSGVDFEYACSRPDGTAPSDDDCDDADPTVGPPSLWYADGDRDGYGAGEPVDPTPTCDSPGPGLRPDWIGLDCDDGDPGVHPNAEEICEDGVDQDCDGIDDLCFANPDCSRNPIWTPVTCSVGSWVWSSDRSYLSVDDAEDAQMLWTGCTHSADGNDDGQCSLDGSGWISIDSWDMVGCDASWYHLGGRYTGNCGGHDGDTVRRLVMDPFSCYDYTDLPAPGE
ncbi:MAG: hypothetical protein ACI9K2_007465, partial [Myxococcota bacterium]